MSKRHNIAYVRPQDPSFLRKLKEQVGYKEGPTVDTKREVAQEDIPDENSSGEESRDEKPTVVVLNPGDLTAEEAEREKKQLEKETEETPADLSKRVIFKRPAKNDDNTQDISKTEDAINNKGSKSKSKRANKSSSSSSSKSKKPKSSTNLLSFDDDDDGEDA